MSRTQSQYGPELPKWGACNQVRFLVCGDTVPGQRFTKGGGVRDWNGVRSWVA